MTWAAILVLAAAAYAFKALGPLVVGRRTIAPDVTQVLELVAVPVLTALIDARVPALCVAALLVRRRAPFLVVVFAAAATAALLRAAF